VYARAEKEESSKIYVRQSASISFSSKYPLSSLHGGGISLGMCRFTSVPTMDRSPNFVRTHTHILIKSRTRLVSTPHYEDLPPTRTNGALPSIPRCTTRDGRSPREVPLAVCVVVVVRRASSSSCVVVVVVRTHARHDTRENIPTHTHVPRDRASRRRPHHPHPRARHTEGHAHPSASHRPIGIVHRPRRPRRRRRRRDSTYLS